MLFNYSLVSFADRKPNIKNDYYLITPRQKKAMTMSHVAMNLFFLEEHCAVPLP